MPTRHHVRREVPPFPPAVLLVLLAFLPAARAQSPQMTASGAAVATGSDLLETTITVERLVMPSRPEEGSARFVAADRISAGDELHYTIRVRNPGTEPVTDVRVTKGMPQGVQYLEGSAVGPACDLEFSTDGGLTFASKPTDPHYTHLRWILRRPLPPGATALLRFRATFH